MRQWRERCGETYRRLKRMSHIRLFLTISALLILPFLICTAIAVTLMIDQTKSDYIRATVKSAQQMAAAVNSELENLLSAGRLIASDQALICDVEALTGGAAPDGSVRRDIEAHLDQYERSFLISKNRIPGVALITKDGTVFGRELRSGTFSGPAFLEVQSAFYGANQNIRWFTDADLLFDGVMDRSQCIYLMLAVRDPSSLQINATVVFQIRVSVLIDLLLPSVDDSRSMFLFTEDGNCITMIDNLKVFPDLHEIVQFDLLQTQQNYTREGTHRSIEYVLSDYTVVRGGWHMLSVSNMREQLRTGYTYLALYAVIVPILLLAAAFLSYHSSVRFTRPITVLNEHMRLVQKGDFQVQVPIERDDEMGELTQQFNTMVQQIRHLIAENNAEQEAKRISDIQFLQSQINPHFIYNTLTVLRSVLMVADRERADRLVLALNRLLRYTLSDAQQTVTLVHSFEWVENYLLIANCSLDEPIVVEYDIQEEVHDCKIVKMMIQPIVENGTLQGLKQCRGKPKLKISAHAAGPLLEIKIQDNGPGFDVSLLDGPRPQGKAGSIGVANVDKRIKLYYGEGYGLHYDSVYEGEETGTTVTIRIPMILEQEEEVLLDEDLDR